MAITEKKRGYALIVAVILTSVVLSFGTALSSLAYKQKVLASDAAQSQYAFYAADAALECALYADQQKNLFDYASHSESSHPALITSEVCTSMLAVERAYVYYTGSSKYLTVLQRLSVGESLCADVFVEKYNSGKVNIHTLGYNVSCDDVQGGIVRFVSRGLEAKVN